MPLVRIDLIRGRRPDELRAIADATHRALVDVLDIPERDRFQIITEHDTGSRGADRAGHKRRPATKLGWAAQWGTVRMLGVFLTEDPLAVPPGAVAFVAEQLDLDPACLADCGQRPKTAYEHAWQIRELRRRAGAGSRACARGR
ncbi:DUF4158 domain-containing protein [Microbispora sp. GKU 823]|uniref:DUF4158 domain-containing protein n=1 Tax=Microbispora sp. GKU 823 TaxID=1652100 RepID=UPI001C4E1D3F|nr:DUF4158 domain-containing protein [Microbispora sp. GKU 823]